MPDHDNGYKNLFSHASMVADLLKGFVHEDWIEGLDLSTLERVNASYVTGDLRSRESDVVWRARWGGDQWIYIYILLEFQSTVDPSMALRVLAYVALLYQDLQKEGVRTASGKLPPVLPIVAYNGKPIWSATREVADLIEVVPGFLEQYRPRLSYFLLDEGRVGEADLAQQNVVAALLRLERSRGPEDVRHMIEVLLAWLAGAEHADLRRDFAVWIRQVLLPARLPGVQVPEVEDLKEVKSMLAERVVEWTREWEQEGVEKGMAKGIEKGIEKGRLESLEKGRATLVRLLEERFGPLPASALGRLQEIDSVEQLIDLGVRTAEAGSLDALGLS